MIIYQPVIVNCGVSLNRSTNAWWICRAQFWVCNQFTHLMQHGRPSLLVSGTSQQAPCLAEVKQSEIRESSILFLRSFSLHHHLSMILFGFRCRLQISSKDHLVFQWGFAQMSTVSSRPLAFHWILLPSRLQTSLRRVLTNKIPPRKELILLIKASNSLYPKSRWVFSSYGF